MLTLAYACVLDKQSTNRGAWRATYSKAQEHCNSCFLDDFSQSRGLATFGMCVSRECGRNIIKNIKCCVSSSLASSLRYRACKAKEANLCSNINS